MAVLRPRHKLVLKDRVNRVTDTVRRPRYLAGKGFLVRSCHAGLVPAEVISTSDEAGAPCLPSVKYTAILAL